MDVRELVSLLEKFDPSLEVVLLTSGGSVRTVDDAYQVKIHADKRMLLPTEGPLSSEDKEAAEKAIALETE